MGLFKGMTPTQAHQTSMDIFKTGIGAALEKQRMEQEKKRLEFEQMMRKQALQLERRRLDLFQSEVEMKNTVQKGKLEGMLKFQQGVQDIRQPPGRRPMGPTGVPVPPAQRQAQKAGQIAMLGAQYGQPVPAAIGQMAKGVTPQPPQPFTLGPGQQRYTGEGQLLATAPPKPEKPSYARYKSAQGGIMDMETKQWIVEPPKEGEPVTFEHIKKAMEVLDKMGMKDVYWKGGLFGTGLFGTGEIKSEWLKSFIEGREVSPELAVSLRQKFPDIQLKSIDPKYQRGFEIWQAANPGKTYQDFLNELNK